jgi:hypothetical protein
LAKIGTLRELGGQDLRPKNFKCGWGLSYGQGIKALEKKNPGDFTVNTCKLDYFAYSPQGFTATRCSKIKVFGHFLLVQTLLDQVLFEFLKNINFIKFW